MAEENITGGHMKTITVNEKYTLTIKEAAAYFSIREKKMHALEDDLDELGSRPAYSIFAGKRYLIVRHLFEEHLMETMRKDDGR